ncbi:MAG: hypothetical protein ACREMQ_03525 [Longimicrobiales bacterium]
MHVELIPLPRENGGDLDLAQKAIRPEGRRQLGRQDLDGHPPVLPTFKVKPATLLHPAWTANDNLPAVHTPSTDRPVCVSCAT